ncbi:rifin PIR protein, putative [Plasmodium reichenowi]|uniref:Rifin PIR protein, putative n=1 Tax=Plasmodium reichenowi TaxID=5854 RepID=A0A2P9DKT7_PLARE|nr:rifin PIR protein, putative [Plasmodium reichenowi]
MKLHYYKILLFAFLLNILITLYHVNTHRKTYNTPRHTPRYTSRMLSECDIQSSGYDKDADMKSVKENFERQTSQRLREYDERMQEKRQKRKEEREKNIQNIIEKDKIHKSLAEKIEKGCLKCGCGLGGVAASVGLFGGLGIYGWKNAAIATVEKAAAAKGLAEGAEKGVKVLIDKLQEELGIRNLYSTPLKSAITAETYYNEDLIYGAVKEYYQTLCAKDPKCGDNILFSYYYKLDETERTEFLVRHAKSTVEAAVKEANDVKISVTATEMTTVQADELKNIAATSTYSYSAIGYSVLAILIIVLVMIIIYLVLRYRRKKKMNKKAQYTKLLNQ